MLYFNIFLIIFVFFVLILNLYLIRLAKCNYRTIKDNYTTISSLKDEFKSQLDNNFKQIECFQNLHKNLNFKRSLPLTRGWAGSPDFLLKISDYVLKESPGVIVECSSGISTIVLAKSLENVGKGHVFSLDHDPLYAQKTRDELFAHGLCKWATVYDAPLCQHNFNGEVWLWYSIDNLQINLQIDMLVIDGPPDITGLMARYPAAPVLFHKLRSKSTIFLDDSLRKDEKLIAERWAKEWPDLVQYESYCEKGCLQLIKSNGEDN